MIRAFSPGSITLFFEIRDEKIDPLRRGSRGVGVCISEGMVTEVSAGDKLEIYLNRKKIKHSIQEDIAKIYGFSGKIESFTELPVSQGFGMSAAAALSTALALERINNGTYMHAAQVAHRIEIERRSGLGDVASQYEGGFTVRTREGIQPYGVVDRIFFPNTPMSIVILDEAIETRRVIGDKDSRRKIKKEGHLAMEKFLRAPSLKNAIKIAREFALNTGLINEEGKNLLQKCENAAIAMIGNSAVIFGECGRDLIEEYPTYIVNLGNRAGILSSPQSPR
ncbi:putative kinase, sugar kinase superfamily [Aciduliprofundum sp. MAR08-339]|uniref:GHMP family kinase ATP-binding protein n=1 Tax=Aciduliprofundum sp. (strain MAR08-339) TaxID=673860 RepID=UPI0002A48122|nr:putative kinase, sugar kinase superfamily [Aciduliprofundum sp. MAR08-339]